MRARLRNTKVENIKANQHYILFGNVYWKVTKVLKRDGKIRIFHDYYHERTWSDYSPGTVLKTKRFPI